MVPRALVVVAAVSFALAACQQETKDAGYGQKEQPVAAASAPEQPTEAADLAAQASKHAAVTSEARATLGKMARDLVAHLSKEEGGGDVLALDDEPKGATLPESSKPVPASLEAVKGATPHTAKAEDWESWKAVGVRLTEPQHCQYQWVKTDETKGQFVAKCDYTGDGKADVHFEQPVAVVDGELKVATQLDEKLDEKP